MVVGAPWADGNKGAAYIYARSSASWALKKQLVTAAQQTAFGASVAIDQDVIAIGAPEDKSAAAGGDGDAAAAPTGSGLGAAFVYRQAGSDWTKEAYIKATNPRPFARFGSSLSLAQGSLVVGAHGEPSLTTGIDSIPNADGSEIGAAYVFRRASDVWSQKAYVKPPIAHNGDVFGASVATDGDTLLVGSPGESSNAAGITIDPNDASATRVNGSGAAYVF